MTLSRRDFFATTAALAGTSLLPEWVSAAETPWPSPVKDFVPPKPNEHPRLFFRVTDLPRIRKQAETPAGKVIVARLRELLGGGDEMPTEFNPNKGKQKDGSSTFAAKAPTGKTYTLWHGAGFGFLYHLTGDQKHADLARQCVEKALDGQRDRDNRYSFRDPTGALRAGPSLGAIAMAYDLGASGWDADFRKKVATAIANYDEGPDMSLASLAHGKRLKPTSNHWGCQIGGALLALLAVKGDDGTDARKLDPLLAAAGKNIIVNVTEGFGDGGYFWEHAGPGQISSDTAFLPGVHAMKVAGGQDYISPRPNVSMVTMIRVYELMRKKGGGHHYPLRHPSSYGTQEFGREGLSRGGQVCQGFGAIKDEYRPALLWTYNHVLEPDPAKRTYDLISPYPHRPMLALVNWPWTEAEKNPAEVLPRVLHDSIRHYYVFRNRWQDENDILVTGLWGARAEKGANERVMVWAFGEKAEWSGCAKSAVKQSELTGVRPDGSGVAKIQDVSMAIDFGKASGADGLLVMAGPGAGFGAPPKGEKFKATSVKADGAEYHVLTLSATGMHPEAKADGGKLVVGGQVVSMKDGTLVLEKGE